MKTLILGLGNPLLTDDGVGIIVVRAVAEQLEPGQASVVEAAVGGFRLLEVLAGFERLIMVDAIQTPDGTAGAVYRFGPNDVRTSRHAGSSHDLSFPAALALGRRLGMVLPEDEAITIIAVEVVDVLSFGETCTPAVAAAIPRAVAAVLAER